MEKSRHLCEPTPQAQAKTILLRNRQSNQIRFASMYKLRLDLLGRSPVGLEVNPLKIQRCSSPLQPDRVPTHSHKPFPNQQSQSNKICFYRNRDISASQHHRPQPRHFFQKSIKSDKIYFYVQTEVNSVGTLPSRIGDEPIENSKVFITLQPSGVPTHSHKPFLNCQPKIGH